MNIFTAWVVANQVLVMAVLALSLLSFAFLWAVLAAASTKVESTTSVLDDEDALVTAIQVVPWLM